MNVNMAVTEYAYIILIEKFIEKLSVTPSNWWRHGEIDLKEMVCENRR
jgi:hypothetical protein